MKKKQNVFVDDLHVKYAIFFKTVRHYEIIGMIIFFLYFLALEGLKCCSVERVSLINYQYLCRSTLKRFL